MSFFGLIPHIYYYVPPCPVCGSEITGRYIRKYINDNTRRIIEDGFRHGEIIKLVPSKVDRNCFCLNCNHEWADFVTPSLKNDAQLQEEIEKRHINELYEYFMSEEVEPEKKRRFFS